SEVGEGLDHRREEELAAGAHGLELVFPVVSGDEPGCHDPDDRRGVGATFDEELVGDEPSVLPRLVGMDESMRRIPDLDPGRRYAGKVGGHHAAHPGLDPIAAQEPAVYARPGG